MRHGWPLPISIPLGLYRHLVELANAPKREVNRRMRAAFKPGTRAHRSTRDVLLDSPAFESRRPLLRQAFRAQRRGEWYLVINALLPLVEGVLVDAAYASDIPPDKARPQRALSRLRDAEPAPRFLEQAAIDSLETIVLPAGGGVALFSDYDPSHYGGPGEPQRLNRNAILHGLARRYGTELNALKLYLLLVVLAECAERSTLD